VVVLERGRHDGGLAVSEPIDLATPVLDRFRAEELSRLDRGGHRYFDYTGAGLYAASQIRLHARRLLEHTYGNPHSRNPTSTPATELVEAARQRVLDHFDAGSDYECIFTANATAAIKLVGESFDFRRRSRLLLSADNHNSVNGLREFARAAGARVAVAPIEAPSLRLDLDVLPALLADVDPDGGLFALPAQSNYSGVQHPLDVVDLARARGWTVLLDAAAFAPTNRLSLRDVPADFVAVSFYKMFGFPTGVGALLARREALRELSRPWFAGGTVALVSVAADDHRLSSGGTGFEDGTPNFLDIPAVGDGLDVMERLGIDTIHERVTRATAALLDAFAGLRHPEGSPLVEILGPTTTAMRGGTIAFNLLDVESTMLHDRLVQEMAASEGISLRSGCFCNPGAGEAARGYTRADMAELFRTVTPSDFCAVDEHFRSRTGRGASALRASVGWGTDSGDLEALVAFLEGFAGLRAAELGAPPGLEGGNRPDGP
jgi:selenocysteine lyase/cysteine desulfurase